MRAWRWVSPLAVSVLGLAVHAAPGYAAAHNFTARYTGSARWSEDIIGDVTGATSETLSWDVKVFAEYRSPSSRPTIQKSMVARGTLTVEDSQGTHTCTIRQAAHPDLATQELSASFLPGGRTFVSAYLGIPRVVPGEVTVTGPAQCQTANVTGNAAEGAKGAACTIFPPGDKHSREAVAAIYFPLQATHGTASRRFDVHQAVTNTRPCGNARSSERITRTIDAVGTIGGAPPPPRRHRPRPLRSRRKALQKLAARNDLLVTLSIAPGPCALAAIGATAGVWGLTVPGSGALALVPAAILGAAAGPACRTFAQRIFDDAEIAADPPRRDYRRVARVAPARVPALPGCGAFAGEARTFCGALRTAVRRYLAAVLHTTAVDDALRVTVDRESGAANARNRGALARQDAAGRRLEVAFASARHGEAKLGARVAGLVRARRVAGRLSPAQFGQGANALLARLAPRGVSRRKLGSLAGTRGVARALAPRAVEVLKTLR